MKKFVGILCCIVLVASLCAAFVGCTPRENTLKLYVPGEYIDEDIFEAFESWYLEQTGTKVKVVVETFEAVEDIKLAVESSRADYDLLCPSDYMIEYLIKKQLVQKVDKSVIDVSKGGLIRSEYLDVTAEFDPTLEYAVPYMYGTLGLVYDITKTNGQKITSWSALFGDQYAGKRSIKDSVRDAYAAVCIYNAASDIDAVTKLTGEAQKEKIQSIFNDTSDATIRAAKETLLNMKTEGDIWDVDQVKFAMAANEKGSPTVALMWSCDAGYVMNTYEDDDGNEKEGNRNLWYVVPDEGGNVYMDAFVISKYAVNVDAANAFLQFICQTDIAVQNSEYAGAISPVAAAYDELYAAYTDPDGILQGADPDWRAMFIETMFPSEATLNRCGVMKDFGDRQNAIVTMISSIK